MNCWWAICLPIRRRLDTSTFSRPCPTVPTSAHASSTTAERCTEAANKRATTAAGLKRQVEGDLDWIVMKALEVDRRRRYDTAIALAEDLGRYLRQEPVSARPPAASYR